MKFIEPRPLADPDAARSLLEIATTVEPIQDGRIHIEKINEPFLRGGGLLAEYGAGLARAIERGSLWKYESGGASCTVGRSRPRLHAAGREDTNGIQGPETVARQTARSRLILKRPHRNPIRPQSQSDCSTATAGSP
jgi:hypothetical protein